MLEEQPRAIEPDVLNSFCQTVISHQSANWPPEESVLATELLDFFGSISFQARDALQQVCCALGITVSFAALPPELRGYNCWFGDKKEIVISTDQSFPGADEHTLLHELREILEGTFEQLGYPTVARQNPEERAERFAVSVRAEAIYRMVPTFCDYADNVDRKWARIAAYVFLGLFVCANLLGCALLPRLEDAYAHNLEQTRNVRGVSDKEVRRKPLAFAADAVSYGN